MRHILPVAAAVAIACSSSYGAQWTARGQHTAIRDHLLLNAADAEIVDYPSSNPESDFAFKIDGKCFLPTFRQPKPSVYKVAVLALMDKQKNLKVAILSNTANELELRVTPVIVVACPTIDSPDGLPRDNEARMKEILRRIRAVQNHLQPGSMPPK